MRGEVVLGRASDEQPKKVGRELRPRLTNVLVSGTRGMSSEMLSWVVSVSIRFQVVQSALPLGQERLMNDGEQERQLGLHSMVGTTTYAVSAESSKAGTASTPRARTSMGSRGRFWLVSPAWQEIQTSTSASFRQMARRERSHRRA